MSDCILWEGARTNGYGALRVGGRVVYAHRLAYEAAYGPVPSGLNVLHSCDNPPCINPEHLRAGTQADNVRDMWVRGRAVPPPVHYGETHHLAKLTAEKARAIRADRRLLREIAADYGVSLAVVSSIRRGRTWRHA